MTTKTIWVYSQLEIYHIWAEITPKKYYRLKTNIMHFLWKYVLNQIYSELNRSD